MQSIGSASLDVVKGWPIEVVLVRFLSMLQGFLQSNGRCQFPARVHIAQQPPGNLLQGPTIAVGIRKCRVRAISPTMWLKSVAKTATKDVMEHPARVMKGFANLHT